MTAVEIVCSDQFSRYRNERNSKRRITGIEQPYELPVRIDFAADAPDIGKVVEGLDRRFDSDVEHDGGLRHLRGARGDKSLRGEEYLVEVAVIGTGASIEIKLNFGPAEIKRPAHGKRLWRVGVVANGGQQRGLRRYNPDRKNSGHDKHRRRTTAGPGQARAAKQGVGDISHGHPRTGVD